MEPYVETIIQMDSTEWKCKLTGLAIDENDTLYAVSCVGHCVFQIDPERKTLGVFAGTPFNEATCEYEKIWKIVFDSKFY